MSSPVHARAARVVRASLFAVALGGFAFLLSSARVPCVLASIFRTPCPGCGSTRAVLALAAGDLPSCVRYGPLAPIMTVLIVVLAIQAFASLLATGTLRGVGGGSTGKVVFRVALVIATLQFVIWIARFAGFLGGPVPV